MLSVETLSAGTFPRCALHLSPALDGIGISKRCVPFSKFAHYTVDDGDVLVPHVVDHDLADVRLLYQVSIPYQ